MNIVLATPVYPPEIADAAIYAKELAQRLSKNHNVTVITYSHLPEPLPGVTITTVEKRLPLLARLIAFRRALAASVRKADAMIVINGASVELPILLVRWSRSMPLIFCIADTKAHARAGLIEKLALLRADHIVTELPLRRPEILPFAPEPTKNLAVYEQSWSTHLAEMHRLFHHAS